MAKKDNEEVILQQGINRLDDKLNTLALAENTNTQKIASIVDDVAEIKGDIARIKSEVTKTKEYIYADVKKEFVTNHRFEPVKLICYGLAGGVFMTVLGAILGTVVMTPKFNHDVPAIVKVAPERAHEYGTSK